MTDYCHLLCGNYYMKDDHILHFYHLGQQSVELKIALKCCKENILVLYYFSSLENVVHHLSLITTYCSWKPLQPKLVFEPIKTVFFFLIDIANCRTLHLKCACTKQRINTFEKTKICTLTLILCIYKVFNL